MTTLQTLQALLKENFAIDGTRLSPETRLEELNIDSLAVVEVLFMVEDKFKVTVPTESVAQQASLKTIGDLVSYVDRLVGEQLSSGDAKEPA